MNRHTKASKGKQRLLDESKRDHFRYYAREALEGSTTPEDQQASIIQTLWAKGSRQGLDEARDFLTEKEQEGVVDADLKKRITDIIRRYSRVR